MKLAGNKVKSKSSLSAVPTDIIGPLMAPPDGENPYESARRVSR